MKVIFTFFMLVVCLVGMAQPDKIHYQGVAYNSSGLLVKNTSIGLRFSIIDSIATGTLLYSETHHPTTDASGLFSVYIGAGTPVSGVFSDLPWANGKEKFLKVEMDITGGTSYLLIGVSPLVSVPYAITAGSLVDGTILYGKDGKNYKLTVTSSGPVWSCYPPAPIADAGRDSFGICSNSISLWGNSAPGANSKWRVIYGVGGVLADSSSATSLFTGNAFSSYALEYELSNACGTTLDTVNISFGLGFPANAGLDQTIQNQAWCSLTANDPSVPGEVGLWKIISGDPYKSLFSKIDTSEPVFVRGRDSVFLLEYSLTNSCRVTRDTVQITFSNLKINQPCPGIPILNYDGKNYPTVLIEDLCWMAKNLDVGYMQSNTLNQANDGQKEKYCYNNIPANCDTFGGLYQWAEAVQYQNGANNSGITSPHLPSRVQGICPSGWHLPNSNEWDLLRTYFGGELLAGGALKSDTNLWNNPNNYASNISGFSALPMDGNQAKFWGNTEVAGFPTTFIQYLSSSTSLFRASSDPKTVPASIRCVKDTICLPSIASAGPDQLNLTGNTATLSANAPAAGETGSWSIISGSGANIVNSNNPTSVFNIGTDTVYSLVWTISGVCGFSTDTVNISFVCAPQFANAGLIKM